MPSARTVVLIVILAAAGLGAWLIVTQDQRTPAPAATASAPSATPVPAQIVTAEELPALAASAGHPVYWLGERAGRRLEWNVRADGAAIVRYLPRKIKVGDASGFLSVASYPLADPVAAVEEGAQRSGAVSDVLPDGARVTATSSQATNAYFAEPGQSVLAEVFSPDPGKAYDLIRAGRLELVPQP